MEPKELMQKRIKEAQKHKERHILLHREFDELLADFIQHTGGLPSKTTLSEFMKWAYNETIKPTEKNN